MYRTHKYFAFSISNRVSIKRFWRQLTLFRLTANNRETNEWLIDNQPTQPDLFSGVGRQKEREQTDKWKDGRGQNHVDDIVEWASLQVDSVRNVNVRQVGVHFCVTFERHLYAEIGQLTHQQ